MDSFIGGEQNRGMLHWKSESGVLKGLKELEGKQEGVNNIFDKFIKIQYLCIFYIIIKIIQIKKCWNIIWNT